MLIEDCIERCDQAMVAPTHNMNDGREERVARYKEERRRQLAAQFGSREVPAAVRSTRASRLRSIANTESVRTTKAAPITGTLLEGNKSEEEHVNDVQKKEKDKSYKRKSYLNRSVTTEVVPPAASLIYHGEKKKESGWRGTRRSITGSREASESSAIPRSSQLVKRQVVSSRRNERGSTPESDGSSGSSRIPRKVTTPSPLSTSPHKPQRGKSSCDAQPMLTSSLPTSPARQPHSILKKSSLDETSTQHPVSILKRKTSQEDGGGRSGSPVRFSPNTIEKKGRGILKKHRSLDDSRNSPEVNNTQNGSEEWRPILKSQERRCSLEECVASQTNETNQTNQSEPQGILKRKSSRDESNHQESEPQGILKRKTSSPSGIAAAESVIRSAAESLADLDIASDIRPILVKKKDQDPPPRPILKKKSSSEEEEHPVKPILKPSKKDEDMSGSESGGKKVEMKPILKHCEDSAVVRRSGSSRGERQSLDAGVLLRRPKSPLALDMARPRPLSVAERVYNLETFLALEGELSASRRLAKMEGEEGSNGGNVLERSGSVSERASIWAKMENERRTETGATPPRNNPKGTGRTRSKVDLGRFNTQPVTQGEVEQAKRNNTNNSLDCVDEEDPSQLSVTERVKLFSKSQTRGQVSGLPPRPVIARTSSSSIVTGLMKNVEEKNSGGSRMRPKMEETIECEAVERKGSSSSSGSSSSGEESSEEGEEVRNITRVVRKQMVTGGTRAEVSTRREEEEEETSSSGGREVTNIMTNGAGRRERRNMDRYGEVSAIRRCATQPIPSHHNDETDDSPLTIAQRLAALQKSGHSEWKKRIARPKPEEELPPPSAAKKQGRALADRVGKLETAAQGWKARIPAGDSSKFTVAGRMTPSPTPAPALGGASRTPAPVVFQAPHIPVGVLRSASMPSKDLKLPMNGHDDIPGPLVTVPQICNEEFSSFFSTPLVSIQSIDMNHQEIDFEQITTHSQLLVHKKKVKVQRKHHSANPLKALAQRSDLKTQYVEVRSSNLERERRRANIEKMSRKCGLAAEALAGLASVEDVKSVSLRKAGESPKPWAVTQWRHPLLLRVKGRRHPVTSVVAPLYTSINQGDSFVLITQSQVYHWVGEYANVIEKARGKEIAQEVQLRRDLGCLTAPNVVTLQGQGHSEYHKQFWELLSLPQSMDGHHTGEAASQHPDEEDLVFETAIAETYMVYSLFDEQLVPVQSSWGKLPRVELLESSKVLVFDFGSEVYVWSGKNVESSDRKLGSHLAKELHKQRHTNWHPTRIEWLDAEMEGKERPEWSIVCKVTQHMEPVLFREKFADWPSADISSTAYMEKQVDGSVDVSPCNVDDMVNWSLTPPDFVLEATHLGRGKTYFDENTRRHLEVLTIGLKGWRVVREGRSADYKLTEVGGRSVGQVHRGESYVLRWEYRVTVSGRELGGDVSKHGKRVGRERLACLVWQGSKAPMLEQGAAALLAIEEEAGGKIVLEEGSEPPAFRAALPGPLVVHNGRHDQEVERIRLFACSGEVEPEAMLQEVSPEASSLRSRASFWMLDTRTGKSYLWHGSQTLFYHKQVSMNAVGYLMETRPPELGLGVGVHITVEEIEEGDEPHDFLSGVEDREEYNCYLDKEMDSNWVTRIFHLNPVQGELKAIPIVSTCVHPDFVTAYPYLEQDLYSIIQPGLAMVDSGDDIWVWEGWSEDNGGAGLRREARRRAAMTSALQYSARRNVSPTRVHLVWAGLEPIAFTNLFLTWTQNQDAARANSNDGVIMGEQRSVQEELALLTKCKYPPSALLSHPLPSGVDPTRLELYLESQHFKELFGMSEEEFFQLPPWQQTKLKKSTGLF